MVLDSVDDGTDDIVYDDAVLNEADFEPFVEWLLTETSKHVAGNNELTLAKLRRNVQSLTPKRVGGVGSAKVETLAATAFFEVILPIKYALCAVNKGLHALISSDVCLFHEFFGEPEGKAMKPVMLVALVISKDHLDKTVVSPGVGAYVKGEDILS